MKPSTSLGTTSNVGMVNPSPSVRQAGNIRGASYYSLGYAGAPSRMVTPMSKRNVVVGIPSPEPQHSASITWIALPLDRPCPGRLLLCAELWHTFLLSTGSEPG